MAGSAPSISYPEMQKSSLVLFDMAAFYLPLYGHTWESFFPHYGVLGMVEGLIYQAELALEGDVPRLIWPGQQAQILGFLQTHGLDSQPARRQLDEVGEYFGLVYQLMQGPPDHTAITRTMELRPADIRLLHTILAQRLGQPYNEPLFDLLWPLEVLMDIKANLSEYADDLATGHYNTYQMLVELHREEAGQVMVAEQQRWQKVIQDRMEQVPIRLGQRIQAFMDRHEQSYPSVPIPKGVLTRLERSVCFV